MPRLLWGDAGFEEARRWPLLPSGTMTAGAPIPNIDERQLWLAYFCVVKGSGDPIQAYKDRHSFEEEQEEKFSSTGNPLIDELNRAAPVFSEIDRRSGPGMVAPGEASHAQSPRADFSFNGGGAEKNVRVEGDHRGSAPTLRA